MDRQTMKNEGLPQRVYNLKWPATWKVSEIYYTRVTYFHTHPMSLPMTYGKAMPDGQSEPALSMCHVASPLHLPWNP